MSCPILPYFEGILFLPLHIRSCIVPTPPPNRLQPDMFLIDPPRPLAERRRVAIRAALNLYEGPVSRRAKDLAASYRSYLASAWPREQALDAVPDPRSTGRTLLHRLARLNGGASLCWCQWRSGPTDRTSVRISCQRLA